MPLFPLMTCPCHHATYACSTAVSAVGRPLSLPSVLAPLCSVLCSARALCWSHPLFAPFALSMCHGGGGRPCTGSRSSSLTVPPPFPPLLPSCPSSLSPSPPFLPLLSYAPPELCSKCWGGKAVGVRVPGRGWIQCVCSRGKAASRASACLEHAHPWAHFCVDGMLIPSEPSSPGP